MIPLGSIVYRKGYSKSSAEAFYKYSRTFPTMTCLCKTNFNVAWILEDHLTDNLVFIKQKENNLIYTICDEKDLKTKD